jgi:F-type H+-transporting ATPase subunit alpha
VAIIFAGTQGMLDDVPVDQVRAFEESLHPFIERRHPRLLPDIAERKELTDELRDALAKAIDEAKAEFMMSRGIKAA